MINQTDRDGTTETLIKEIDSQIEELTLCAKDAAPELRKECDDKISLLIANREGIRRGLLRFNEAGELCSSCPSEEVANGGKGPRN
jgi:hypothetical protein